MQTERISRSKTSSCGSASTIEHCLQSVQVSDESVCSEHTVQYTKSCQDAQSEVSLVSSGQHPKRMSHKMQYVESYRIDTERLGSVQTSRYGQEVVNSESTISTCQSVGDADEADPPPAGEPYRAVGARHLTLLPPPRTSGAATLPPAVTNSAPQGVSDDCGTDVGGSTPPAASTEGAFESLKASGVRCPAETVPQGAHGLPEEQPLSLWSPDAARYVEALLGVGR